MTLPPRLRNWYDSLAPREQRLVLAGGLAVVVLVLYLAVVNPVRTAHTRLVNDVQTKRQLLGYINQAAPRLRAQSGAATGRLQAGQSVFAATSAAIQASAIAGAVQRLEQTQDGGVRLTLSNVSFDALVRWLATLKAQTGIVATQATIEQAAAPGTVHANLTLNAHT